MTLAHHPEPDFLLSGVMLWAGSTDAAISADFGNASDFLSAMPPRLCGIGGTGGGGVLLDAYLPPAPLLPMRRWKRPWRGLAPPNRATPRRFVSRDQTPMPLPRLAWAATLAQMRWRRMGAQLAYIPLYSPGQCTDAPAARRPRRPDVGRHDHRGEEYTLVLAGGFTAIRPAAMGRAIFRWRRARYPTIPVADTDDLAIGSISPSPPAL